MKIFVVEDSAPIRRLIVQRLRTIEGISVVGEAASRRHAPALIKHTRPDVVLTDLVLTDGSGLALLNELRAHGYAGRVAVLTACDPDAYRDACLGAGADAFYDKGTGMETLFEDLAERLRRSTGCLLPPQPNHPLMAA